MSFSLMMVPVTLCAGMGFDACRWLNAHSSTMAAIDEAVLAGANALRLHASDHDRAIASAVARYQQSVQTRLPLASDTIAFQITDSGSSVSASGSAYIAPMFLKLAGIERLPVLRLSGQQHSRAELSFGSPSTSNLEVAMVLDLSELMTGERVVELRDAAKDFIEIVVWPNHQERAARVSIVPFAGDVRVPDAALGLVRGHLAPNQITKPVACGPGAPAGVRCTVAYRLSKCVAERAGSERYTDAAPAAGQYAMAVYTTSGSCAMPAVNEVVPLSNDAALLRARMDGLAVGFGAAGHLGAAWGWYTLSPDWNAVWPAAANAAAGSADSETQKVIVFLSAGRFSTQYDSTGVKTTAIGAGQAVNGASDEQFSALCSAINTSGIAVYTIGYGIAAGSPAETALRECATEPSMYIAAADGSQLRQAFVSVGLRLSKVTLTQ